VGRGHEKDKFGSVGSLKRAAPLTFGNFRSLSRTVKDINNVLEIREAAERGCRCGVKHQTPHPPLTSFLPKRKFDNFRKEEMVGSRSSHGSETNCDR
jgi:hypothetical protein